MMLTYLEAKIILKWQPASPKTKAEFTNMMKFGYLPKDIPINPEEYYQNKGWKSWVDFLSLDDPI